MVFISKNENNVNVKFPSNEDDESIKHNDNLNSDENPMDKNDLDNRNFDYEITDNSININMDVDLDDEINIQLKVDNLTGIVSFLGIDDKVIYNREDLNDNESTESNDNKKIYINTATEDELRSLPGFHIVNAKKVIQLRGEHKYMNSFNDLVRLADIDVEYIDDLKEIIIFNNVDDDENHIEENLGRRLDI